MDLLRAIVPVWTQCRVLRTGLAELESCSADELSRCGLDSGDIARVA